MNIKIHMHTNEATKILNICNVDLEAVLKYKNSTNKLINRGN